MVLSVATRAPPFTLPAVLAAATWAPTYRYQKAYFVLESFEDGAAKLRRYCAALHTQLPEDVRRAVGLA